MKKNTKKTLVVVALIALMAIPGMFAYFTDDDFHSREFTVGNVEIDLVTDETKVEKVATDQTVDMKTYVANEGDNPAYVFVAVKEIEKFEPNYADCEGWSVVNGAVPTGYDKVYACDTVLETGDTAVTADLFNKVKFVGEEGAVGGTMNVRAYAIQEEGFEGQTADAIWAEVADAFGSHFENL